MNLDLLLYEMTIANAFIFANDLHKGQYRKGSGAPYIVHPRSVYKILRNLNIMDKDILIASILHDTIEDTKGTYNIIKRQFNDIIADLVKEVTSVDKILIKVGKPNYLANKMIKMSDKALTIKLADRYHNIQDMKSSNKKFIDKMVNQTYFIIKRLRTDRILNNTHKKLIRLINKEIIKYEL